jgi:biopolymer transport protein ExbD
MRFTQTRRPDPLVDVTPMIDVVFQLVLFFMVTTTFVTSPGIQVDLPRASQSTVLSEDRDINLWMTADGAVYLDNAPIDETGLLQALRARAEADPNAQLVIKADAGVSHGRVVTLLDNARNVGLTRYAIATDPDEE